MDSDDCILVSAGLDQAGLVLLLVIVVLKMSVCLESLVPLEESI